MSLELNTSLTADDLDLGADASETDTGDTTAVPGAAFAELGLDASIVRTIVAGGYNDPTPVQAQAVPAALTGRDLLVSSQTGSGKTAAFVWPALQKILEARRAGRAEKRPAPQPAVSEEGQPQGERRGANRPRGGFPAPTGPRVLVLAPTRELAMQVSRACSTYGQALQGLRVAHVVGGVPYHAQVKALRGPVDVLIATPGRLLDLMGSGTCRLDDVQMLVLDEADRMLDMGFIDDIQAVADALPEGRQTLMFSATFAGSVGGLAQQLTRDPQRISINNHNDTHSQIEQRLHWADSLTHKNALLEQLLTDREIDQAVIFTSTQQDADEVAWKLADMGHAVASLHGGMPQGRRNRVLQGLRQGQLRVLVATDVAARGIDVPTITHVINYGLPMKAEDYVHRIGRTGRAGRSGLAITLAERRDVGMIRRIERFTTQTITPAVVAGLEPKLPPPAAAGAGPRREGFGNRGGRGGFGGGNRGGFGGRREGGFSGFGRDSFRERDGGGQGAPAGGGRFESRGPRPEGRAEGGWQDRGAPRRDEGFRPAREDGGGFRGAPREDGFRPAREGGEARRFDRPTGDRPQGQGFGDRGPRGPRPFGDRPQGDRPFGDRPRQADGGPRGQGRGEQADGGDRPRRGGKPDWR
ncbi:MAG: hypothetical protein RIQ53_67 [Pseudomonadota bacterium]|jgi:superfamily II DNA/RNA helicase